MTNHFDLLEQGIDKWNEWRARQPEGSHCNLEGRDLSHGYFFEGNFRNVNLRGANLSRACLVGADFRGADLSGANLAGAYLGDANLKGANLTNTDLSKAKLERADMREVHLFGTQLDGADIRTTQLPTAKQQPYVDEVARLLSQTSAPGSVTKTQKTPQPTKAVTNQQLALSTTLAAPTTQLALPATQALSFRKRLSFSLHSLTQESSEAKSLRQQSIRQSAFAPAHKDTPRNFSGKSARLGRRILWLPALATAAIALAIGLPLTNTQADSQQIASPPESFLTRDRFALAKSLTVDSTIRAVATHTDGTTQIIAGKANGQIDILDSKTGKTLSTLLGHADGISALSLSDSGRWLVSGSSDGLSVWRLATGELIHHIPLFDTTIKAVAIAPDESTFISSDDTGNLTAWTLDSGEELYSIDGGLNSNGLNSSALTWSIEIAPDSQSFMTVSRDRTIQQWTLGTGQPMQSFGEQKDTQKNTVRSIGISPDGQTLISGSENGTIEFWEIANGSLQTTLAAHSGAIDSLAISSDGKTLATSSTDSTLTLWDIPSRQLIQTLDSNIDSTIAVAFDSAQSTLISSSSGNTIKVWK